MRDAYRPMVSQEVLLEMAQEKVLHNEELFSEWLYTETMSPSEIRPSKFFHGISTADLLRDVLMKQNATQEQLAQAWQEVRRRYLDDNGDRVDREFQRLLANGEQS